MGRAAKWNIYANDSNQKRGQMLIVRAFSPKVWPMSLTTASLCRTADNLTEASWVTHTLWSLFLQNQGLKPGHPSDNFCCCYSRISCLLLVLYSLGQGPHQHGYQHHESSKKSQKSGIILSILWLQRKLRLSLVGRPTKINYSLSFEGELPGQNLLPYSHLMSHVQRKSPSILIHTKLEIEIVEPQVTVLGNAKARKQI